MKCWGEEAVQNANEGKNPQEKLSQSIFAAFARPGQQPIHISHRSHTTIEAQARIVKWVTECNRPAEVLSDTELRSLLTAGRPKVEIPSPATVRHDINAAFEKARERICALLLNYPGLLSFATDTWTSPNHCAMCAWTAHLEHEGHPLTFLLDIVEVPESHTGATLAREFQEMLVHFGIEFKVQVLFMTRYEAKLSTDTCVQWR